jgi:hypothetical protein
VKNRVRLFALAILITVFSTVPLVAQPRGTSEPSHGRAEVRLQGWNFGNFFQVSDPAPTQDVSALGTELRAAFRPGPSPLEVYAHANYLNYDETDRESTYGGRIGLAMDTDVHDFNVFVDRAENRASFDIGDTVAVANVTTFGGEYSYTWNKTWQFGAEATKEKQRFNVTTNEENDYNALGASVRYRGFGYKFSPEVGFVNANRDSEDANERYDDDYWYVQLVSIPISSVYVSLEYRARERKYEIDDPTASNFRRVDDRPQWSFVGSYTFTRRVSGLLYYSRESVESSRPGRDFDSDILILSLIVGF